MSYEYLCTSDLWLTYEYFNDTIFSEICSTITDKFTQIIILLWFLQSKFCLQCGLYYQQMH